MDARVIAERRSSLTKVRPREVSRREPEETRPSNPYGDIKLRKTGTKWFEDETEEESWWSWLFGDVESMFCSGFCASEVAPPRPKQRISTARVACEECGLAVYGSSEAYAYQGKSYHKRCFACAGCKTSLASDGIVKHVRGGRRYCSTCVVRREASDRRSSEDHVVGATQEQAGLKRDPSHRGNVTEVLDTIGDQLEEAYRRTRRVCEICGGDFREKRERVEFRIEGDRRVPVAHEECRLLGRPRDGVVHSAQPPRLAIKLAPAQFIVKLAWAKKNMTLYFLKSDKPEPDAEHRHHSKAENERPASVAYRYAEADAETPVAKKRRKAQLAAAVVALDAVDFRVAADDFAKAPRQPAPVTLAPDKTRHTVLLHAVKHRLLHELRLDFDQSRHDAHPANATLTIAIPDYAAGPGPTRITDVMAL